MKMNANSKNKRRGFIGATAVLSICGTLLLSLSVYLSFNRPAPIIHQLFGTVHQVGQWRVEFDEGLHINNSGDMNGLHGSLFYTDSTSSKPLQYYTCVLDIDQDQQKIHLKYALLTPKVHEIEHWDQMTLAYQVEDGRIQITDVIPTN